MTGARPDTTIPAFGSASPAVSEPAEPAGTGDTLCALCGAPIDAGMYGTRRYCSGRCQKRAARGQPAAPGRAQEGCRAEAEGQADHPAHGPEEGGEAVKTSVVEAPSIDFSVDCKALKGLRQRVGLSGRELARRMRVDPSAISRWSSGERNPSLYHLICLCRILGCPDWKIYTTYEASPATTAQEPLGGPPASKP
jgi:DNA-binding transcriptional regulator YiaG